MGPSEAHPDSSVGPAASPTVIIQGHRIQSEPPTWSQVSSNLNFKFTFHASENSLSSHPILPDHSWRPTLSSVDRQSSSVGLAGIAESLLPIRSHHPGPSNTA